MVSRFQRIAKGHALFPLIIGVLVSCAVIMPLGLHLMKYLDQVEQKD